MTLCPFPSRRDVSYSCHRADRSRRPTRPSRFGRGRPDFECCAVIEGGTMSTTVSRVPRRGFLARLSSVAAGLTSLAVAPAALRAGANGTPEMQGGPDAWIDRLKGQDRLLFHAHQQLMPAILGARNVLTNGRNAYGVSESENSIAIGAHGPAISGLFRDEIWQRFTLGERYKFTDPKTNAPAT